MSHRRFPPAIAALLITVAVATCAGGDLRGTARPSADGKTYLVVEETESSACDLRVDGRPWQHELHTPGAVTPGAHSIGCGDGPTIAFEVREGTTFHFDYWGP